MNKVELYSENGYRHLKGTEERGNNYTNCENLNMYVVRVPTKKTKCLITGIESFCDYRTVGILHDSANGARNQIMCNLWSITCTSLGDKELYDSIKAVTTVIEVPFTIAGWGNTNFASNSSNHPKLMNLAVGDDKLSYLCRDIYHQGTSKKGSQ